MIRRMAVGVLGVRFYLCLFLSGTVQAICPEGWSTETGATGFTFDTETTADVARIRCFSPDVLNRQVWDYVCPEGAAWCGTTGFAPCNARAGRCTSAGGHFTNITGTPHWCVLCNAGAIRSGATCNNCGENQYRQFVTANTCQNCPLGKVSTPGGRNITDCHVTSCGAGLYLCSSENGTAPVCKECSAGKFSTALGASSDKTCIWCDAGKYQLYTGAKSESACVGCPVGKFKTSIGS